MRISELAEKGGLNTRAIDYYKDLIPCSDEGREQSSGYRDYGPEAVEVVKKIAILREAGMSLKEIKDHLNDPSYFTTARWNEHIKRLERKKRESIEHYDQMIEYAKTLRDSKSFIFHILNEINDINDSRKISKFYALIISRLEALILKMDEIVEQADDKPNDIALVYLRIDRLFSNIGKYFQAEIPYDSEAVQETIRKFGTALMESYGAAAYCVFDAFKDADKEAFGFFDDIDEDDYRILMQGLTICFDWYREARTIDNALAFEDFQVKFREQIHEFDELVGESTVDGLQYFIRLISYVPTFILGLVKDESSADQFEKGYEFGSHMMESPEDMTDEQKETAYKLTEYVKNAVAYHLREKAKELPENWMDQLDLEFDDEEDTVQ